MRKTLYSIEGGIKYAVACHGHCNKCVVRFKCYTTKDKGLEVTRKESILCGEKEGKNEDDI